MLVAVMAPVSGINRNIVECKFDSQIDALEKYCELIETLWNVNKFAFCAIGCITMN